MLPQEASVAQVIISKLEQPHKFDFVLQCKCGFQSNGYANVDDSLGEADALARQAAATHLINRHGARPAETSERIRELAVTTAGGMSYAQLEQVGLSKGFKKPAEAPAPAKAKAEETKEAKPEPPAKPPSPAAQIAALKATAPAPVKPTEAAQQVQTGGVKK